MIEFSLKKKNSPYIRILQEYEKAKSLSQKNIEAFCLSTCGKSLKPSSRFVNIKYIKDDELIFFTNYKSKKAQEIEENENISGVFYWSKTGVQVRVEGKIKKTSASFSDNHFKKRSIEKNILAISSNQSSVISSYEEVVKKYQKIMDRKENMKRPDYWGGYSIKPSFIEIWQAHKNRLNQREAHSFLDNKWTNFILEP